jgi:nicotinamidase-related amidase
VADVPDPNDPSTQMNVSFLNTINEADIVLLAGEARSHCLANTGRDACNYFSDDSLVKKLVLLEDATSDVTGFENYGEQFVKEMKARGMQTTTCKDFLA